LVGFDSQNATQDNINLNGGAVPIYQFKCQCGIEFEREFKMNDKHLALCECGKLAKKSFTAVPAHFKGTGWGSK
jgi:putative FmdB family regulatory protein